MTTSKKQPPAAPLACHREAAKLLDRARLIHAEKALPNSKKIVGDRLPYCFLLSAEDAESLADEGFGAPIRVHCPGQLEEDIVGKFGDIDDGGVMQLVGGCEVSLAEEAQQFGRKPAAGDDD